jgi:hypothetical protein
VPTQAVNATGAFELDGNAITNHTTAGAPDDWDRVCHDVTASFATPLCTTAGSTNGASALEWAAQGASTGTTFTGGGSKDPIDVSSWAWNQATGGLPGKDILLNGFAARYNLPANPASCPSTTSTCSVVFFGMDRFDNSGDAQNGFWFFQNAITLGTGKSGGGTTFNGVHKNGDVLVVSDFSIGGAISTVTVYRWDTACLAAGKPTGDCADTNLRQLGTSTAANCATSPANAAFCGIVNPANGTVSPWPFTDKGGNITFQQGEFYEGGINLSLFPGLAGECFASTLAESRSSTSTSAVLKSFVLGGFGGCKSKTVTTPSQSGTKPIPTTAASSPNASSLSESDSATITVTGASIFGGTVQFSLCFNPAINCVSGGTPIGSPVGVSGNNGTATVTSPTASVTSVGTYCWRADYSGDPGVGVPGSSDPSAGPPPSTSTSECFSVTPVTPTLGTAAGASSVLLGQAVTDTASLSGTANQPGTPVINPTTAGALAGGNITFTLLGPNDCSTVAFTSSTFAVNGDGTYGPASFVPTAIGTYHWEASYSGSLPNTLATTHNTSCNDTGEDVLVRQLGTSTVTTPVDSSGATATSVVFGSMVRDHAVVTGDSADGTPTGTVNFFVCDPTQVTGTAGSEVCATGGTPEGSISATAITGSTPPKSEAFSLLVTTNKTGEWCFRAVYVPNTSFYTGSGDATHGECFLVTDTTSATSAQNWLPNDTATVTSAHGAPMNGTLTIQLYDGSNNCTIGAVSGQAYSTPVTNVSTATVTSSNATYKVSATDTLISWGVTFTSTDPNVSSSSHCESSSVTVTN